MKDPPPVTLIIGKKIKKIKKITHTHTTEITYICLPLKINLVTKQTSMIKSPPFTTKLQ